MAGSNSSDQRIVELLERIDKSVERLANLFEKREVGQPDSAALVSAIIEREFGPQAPLLQSVAASDDVVDMVP